jgi:hypothetical protein
MQPMLVQGDLAVVKSQSTYKVGDVVLYQNQIIDRDVLHRIYLIQDGHYFFKGDNNDFVDPGYATRSELVGELWFYVPKVGGALGWLGKPFHAALLGGLGAFAFAMSELSPKESRGRRRTRGPFRRRALRDSRVATLTLEQSATPKSNPFTVRSSSPYAAGSRIEPPVKPTTKSSRDEIMPFEGRALATAVIGVLLLLSAIFLAVGLSKPTKIMAPLAGAYTQSGQFSYGGHSHNAKAIYTGNVVRTGDPIYPSLVKIINFGFKYTFSSRFDYNVKGTIQLKAELHSQIDPWKSSYVISAATPFSGNTASVSAALSLNNLEVLIGTITSSSGIAQDTFVADVVPIIHVSGVVDGKKIHQTFAPALPFLVSKNSIILDPAVAPTLPGASYVPPTQASSNAAAVHPTELGTLLHPATNSVTFAKYQIPVAILRLLGFLLALSAVGAFWFHLYVRRRHARINDEVLIASRLHSFVVPVTSLGTLEGQSPIALDDFGDLAKLAQFLDRPILVEKINGHRHYAVDDDFHRYSFHAKSPELEQVGPALRSKDRKASKRRVQREAL